MGYRFTTPVVVSFGEEPFLLDRDLNSFRDQKNYSVTRLDGASVKEASIVSACETYEIDYDDPTNIQPRVVVLDNGHKIKPDKYLKSYLEGRDGNDVSSVLAVVIRAAAVPAFWTKLGSKVTLIEHKKFKTWDDRNEVVGWVVEESKRIRLDLSVQLAKAMFQADGDDLYRLSSELGKLKLLVGKAPVTVEHLRLVMTPSSSVESWDVAEAAFMRSPKKALYLLSELYKYASEEPSLMILGALTKGVERLFVARSMMDKGAAPDEAAAGLGMHPYRFKKSLLPQVEKQTVTRLVKAMQNLCKLDVDLKRTSHRRTLIELAVLDLAS
jgi:DNA polymerase III delta subunit